MSVFVLASVLGTTAVLILILIGQTLDSRLVEIRDAIRELKEKP